MNLVANHGRIVSPFDEVSDDEQADESEPECVPVDVFFADVFGEGESIFVKGADPISSSEKQQRSHWQFTNRFVKTYQGRWCN
jgi:hypothetical protein